MKKKYTPIEGDIKGNNEQKFKELIEDKETFLTFLRLYAPELLHSLQQPTIQRELYSLTEEEVFELLSLDGIEIAKELTKQSDENLIDFTKQNCYWSDSDFLGDKYVIFKSKAEFPDRQQLYIPITWESRGSDDASCGVHPYHIEVGAVTGMMGDCQSPIKVIEWFLRKGFEVGNFMLKPELAL